MTREERIEKDYYLAKFCAYKECEKGDGIHINCDTCMYEKGRADVLQDIAKIIDDYACDRDVKSNVSLGERINEYICEQTK